MTEVLSLAIAEASIPRPATRGRRRPCISLAPSARPLGTSFRAVLCLGFIAYVFFSVFVPVIAHADETAVMRRGDAAVTAFSGTLLQSGDVPGVAPLDRTFLDTAAPTLKVFDLSKLGGDADGQVANAPVKFSVPARDIGQVFGVALDSDTSNRTPNVYVTSTSLYGLQIVDKNGERLVKGEPGARWMPGQFGLAKGGGPGSVWKIDGATGAVSLFANIKHDGRENAGPGLGGIAFDPVSKQLFVTDLETGLIHRLEQRRHRQRHLRPRRYGARQGRPRDRRLRCQEAHEPRERRLRHREPGDLGLRRQAPPRRRRRRPGRARSTIPLADGPVIWSVGITADGSFADDARLEIDVTGTPAGNVVTAIAFDGPNEIYLTQRGEIVGSYDYTVFAKPQTSAVLRYTWDESDKTWSDGADELPIGLEPPHRSTMGGLALSYRLRRRRAASIYGRCRETLWTTGEHLREADTARVSGARNVHGLQGNAKVLAKPPLMSHPTQGSIALERRPQDPRRERQRAADTRPGSSTTTTASTTPMRLATSGPIAIFNPCDKRTAAGADAPDAAGASFPMPGSKPGIYISKQLSARPDRRHHPAARSR